MISHVLSFVVSESSLSSSLIQRLWAFAPFTGSATESLCARKVRRCSSETVSYETQAARRARRALRRWRFTSPAAFGSGDLASLSLWRERESARLFHLFPVVVSARRAQARGDALAAAHRHRRVLEARGVRSFCISLWGFRESERELGSIFGGGKSKRSLLSRRRMKLLAPRRLFYASSRTALLAHFAQLDADGVGRMTYANHEGVPETSEVRDYFRQVSTRRRARARGAKRKGRDTYPQGELNLERNGAMIVSCVFFVRNEKEI